MKLKSALFCAVLALLSMSCFTQRASAGNEELTITTYYPSPYGNYNELATNKLRIGANDTAPVADKVVSFQSLSADPSGDGGDLYYYKAVGSSTGNFRYHNGSGWQDLGGSSSLKIFSGHGILPDTCSGSVVATGICHGAWYIDITFPEPFSSVPDVIVTPERVLDGVATPCSYSATDLVDASPANITTTGFRLYIYGSPVDTGHCGTPNSGYAAKGKAGWLAIGN